MAKPITQKTTVYLDAADYRRLKRVAARRRLPPAQLVREAVAEYVVAHDTRRAARCVGVFASRRRDLGERAEDLLRRGFGKSR
jgi:predicted transcriptional regulator